ncbi:MAG: hypothetical protein A3J83_01485 [Elusimicrobia bacterium RIFOXYA2_FULL_40_6]|nr:MAG: hypothetical protein A3J83_01485 [Elusimicrobia bacterium RIFOXYA2_FULL_40_6]
MKIFEFLYPKAIILDLQSKDKKGAVNELVECLVKEKKLKDSLKAISAVMEREKLGTTGVGQGVAIPHGRTDVVSELVGAVGISKQGVEFEALDGEPVYIIFLLLSPPDSGGQHLRALAKVSRLCKDKFFRQALMESKTKEEILKIIQQEDEL